MNTPHPLKATATPDNPWFGISLLLIGLVIGFGIGNAYPVSGTSSAQVAAVPAAPTPTPAPAAAPTPAPTPTAQNVRAPDDTDHIRGDEDALISVIEYSDFECPFCARHHPTMAQLVEEDDNVNWVYRHYPLGFHSTAQKAAEASECAGEQGDFWGFADLLFERGSDTGNLTTYAEEIGLNVSDFESCLNSGKFAQKVKDQLAEGSASGVTGTPGNIVYNNKTKESRLVSGARDLQSFKDAVAQLQ